MESNHVSTVWPRLYFFDQKCFWSLISFSVRAVAIRSRFEQDVKDVWRERWKSCRANSHLTARPGFWLVGEPWLDKAQVLALMLKLSLAFLRACSSGTILSKHVVLFQDVFQSLWKNGVLEKRDELCLYLLRFIWGSMEDPSEEKMTFAMKANEIHSPLLFCWTWAD